VLSSYGEGYALGQVVAAAQAESTMRIIVTHAHPWGNPAHLPIYARAAVLRLPILFHLGIILKNGVRRDRCRRGYSACAIR
jgi:hypothetical protein